MPIRSDIRTTRWTAFASLVRRTSNRPVFCFIEVGEGEALDLSEEGLAQVAGHALGDLHRQDVVPDREKRAQKRNAEHQERRPDDHPLVVSARCPGR